MYKGKDLNTTRLSHSCNLLFAPRKEQERTVDQFSCKGSKQQCGCPFCSAQDVQSNSLFSFLDKKGHKSCITKKPSSHPQGRLIISLHLLVFNDVRHCDNMPDILTVTSKKCDDNNQASARGCVLIAWTPYILEMLSHSGFVCQRPTPLDSVPDILLSLLFVLSQIDPKSKLLSFICQALVIPQIQ